MPKTNSARTPQRTPNKRPRIPGLPFLPDKRLTLVLWSLIYFILTAWIARVRPLWADELTTSYVSRLPSVPAIWHMLVNGGDAHPPLSFILVHFSYAIFGAGTLPTRLPSVVAFWIACLCLFRIAKRHGGFSYGLFAMTIPLATGAYGYAYEARPYALLLAAGAAAFLAWVEAARRTSRWQPIWLVLALWAGVSSHFFAPLLAVSMGCGEAFRILKSRKIDVPVWAALVAGVAPVALYFPIARAAGKLYFQGAFWSKPTASSVLDTYRTLLGPAEVPCVITLLVWAALFRRFRDTLPAQPFRFDSETVAILTLLLFPVYAVLASFATGAYTERYGIAAVLGVSLALCYFSRLQLGGARFPALAAAAVFLGWFTLKQASTLAHEAAANSTWGASEPQPFRDQPWVRFASSSTLPLAATDGVFFEQLFEYPPSSALRRRTVYLADSAKATEMGFSPSGEINLQVVSRLLEPLPLRPYNDFLSRNPQFLLCVRVSHEGWLPPYLLKRGANLRLRVDGDEYKLYEVSFAQ